MHTNHWLDSLNHEKRRLVTFGACAAVDCTGLLSAIEIDLLLEEGDLDVPAFSVDVLLQTGDLVEFEGEVTRLNCFERK